MRRAVDCVLVVVRVLAGVLFCRHGSNGVMGRLAAMAALRRGMALGFGLSVAVGMCYAGDIVMVRGNSPHEGDVAVVRKLADFYGVKLYTFETDSREMIGQAVLRLKNRSTLALVAFPEALLGLDRDQVLSALRRPRGNPVPMLVLGVGTRTDRDDLTAWSGGGVQGCVSQPNEFRPERLEVGSVASISRGLAGRDLPVVSVPQCSMQVDPGRVETVLAARGHNQVSAVLLRTQVGAATVFFTPQMASLDKSWMGQPAKLPQAFSSMAPLILFLSYAVRDYSWHLDGQYANLTIDDVWLTQPYGRLDYPALLSEMEKHNFHTTAAFIPWNFDRSEHDLVTLFRSHPDRFSISLHGNDHKHREFGDYSKNSLQQQIADVKQGVARMERFQSLTGIPYDRFMVFPQGVAPEKTFAALKTYDFTGTANSQNVPLNTAFPTDPVFLLRPYTSAYANFPSLFRYTATAQIPRLEIALESFLGNPILFYSHEDLFGPGVAAFDGIANFVNEVKPDTQWVSLGTIARHLHLMRRREDGGFDVRMSSSEMDLKNPTDGDAVFYVERDEGSSPVIRSLMIDGVPAVFEHSGSVVRLRLMIPAYGVKKFRVTYRNDLDLSRQETGKGNLYAYTLRMVSDFRDLHLARSSWGRIITQTYYRRGWNLVEQSLERKWLVAIACLMFAFAGLRYRRWKSRRRVTESNRALNSSPSSR